MYLFIEKNKFEFIFFIIFLTNIDNINKYRYNIDY